MPSHSAAGAVARDLEAMAERTGETRRRTTRRPRGCSKHAFAPSAQFRPRIKPAGNVTLPAQRHNRAHPRAQFASGTSVAGDDPVNGSDPSGLCVSLFNVVCVGGGSVSSTLSFKFDPGAAANAVVNIGRGASFGLSDTIANWISPGASCTVTQNGLDQAIGSAATIVASFGAGAEAASSQRIGDLAYGSRLLGPDSALFGNSSLGETDASGLLNPPGRGAWRLGWSVDGEGSSTVPGFRLKAPFIGYQWLLHASGF